MSSGQLSDQLAENIIQVGAMSHIGNQLAVPLFHSRPVHPVQIGIVEPIPLDAPHVLEHLFPFQLGIDVHDHFVDRQLAFRLLVRRQIHNAVGIAFFVNDLLAVRRDVIASDFCENGFFLALFQIVAVQAGLAFGAAQIDRAVFHRLQIAVISSGNVESHHAIDKAIHVDIDGRNLLRLVCFVLLFFGWLFFRPCLFIAFRRKGRGNVLAQGADVDA